MSEQMVSWCLKEHEERCAFTDPALQKDRPHLRVTWGSDDFISEVHRAIVV